MTLQEEIISRFGVKKIIEPRMAMQRIVEFITWYLTLNCNFKSLVLGISGGQDSTLTGKLCQIAVNNLRKKHRKTNLKFIALRLPYGKQIDEKDCQTALSFINPDQIIDINIKNMVAESEKSLIQSGSYVNDSLRGNLKSRTRMQIQHFISASHKGIVVGTGHAAEGVTGYFTKYGDGGTDLNPIAHLNKRQGKEILIYLNCPKKLYEKIPTADLEDKRPAFPDEYALGVTYNEIDDYLEGKEISSSSQRLIEYLYIKTQHKRNMPVNIFDKNFCSKYRDTS